MIHLVQIRTNQKSFKMKLNCICWVLPTVTMRAQDLPAYIKSKKISNSPLDDPTGRFKWQGNLKPGHPPLSSYMVHVAGLAVLEPRSGLSCMCSSVVFSGLSCMWQGKSFRNPSGYTFATHPVCAATHPMYSRSTS